MIEKLYIFSNNILNGLLIALVGGLVAIILGVIFDRALKNLLGKALSAFIANIVRLLVLVWTLKIILELSGAEGLVVILVTVLTGAFALGSERFASDILSGIKLFTTRPYDLGDFVYLNGYEGKVISMDMVTTTIEGVNGEHIIIRNAEVMDNTIINQSAKAGQLIHVMVPLPAGEDLEIATRVIMEAIENFSDVENPPFPPSVVCEELYFGYAKMQVNVYMKEKVNYGPDKARLMITSVAALKKHGIALKN